MENKMIPEDIFHNDFLSTIIRSTEPTKAPDGFLEGVMNRIGPVPASGKAKPYSPPAWLKWGVPGVIVTCVLALLLWTPSKQPAIADSGLSPFENFFDRLSTWFSGFNPDLRFTNLYLSPTLLWILAGGIVLWWGFWFLSRFLEKHS
jgi:hypothetical protein